MDVPTWSLDDARLNDRLAEALSVKAANDELISRLVREVDERDLASKSGASSTRAHLIAAHQMSAAEATRTVATARAMTERCENTRREFAAGHVSAEQALVVAEAVNRLSSTIDPLRIEAAQADLLDHAARLSVAQLRVVANHLVEVVDPDGADETLEQQLQAQEERARKQTMFVGQFGADGISRGRFAVPNVTFAMLKKALDACASPRRDHHLFDDGTCEPLGYESRMGLAFCELIEHLPVDGLPQHGVANASIVVTVDEDKLRAGAGEATLDTGGTVSISEVRRLACNAGILPLVLGGESRILDLGVSRRLFDRYQRLALAARDRGCVFAGCQRPPAWCEAHHLKPWSEGGATDLVNGCLLCSFHHHLVHQGEWDLSRAPDGIIEVIPPTRIDPTRRPIRHERFKPRPG